MYFCKDHCSHFPSISIYLDAVSLREELEITNLDPKEAHAKFVERVKDNKQATETMSNKIEATQDEVDRLRYVQIRSNT